MVAEPSAAGSSDQGFELVGEVGGLSLRLARWTRFARWIIRRAIQKRTWWAIGQFLQDCKKIENRAREEVEREFRDRR